MQQCIIKVSSGRFYYQQEEVLNQKNRGEFVFNYLAVDIAGQLADNKHTGNMIFPFFLLVSKTDKPLGDDTFQNLHTVLQLLFSILSPFKLKLMPSNEEFP